MKENRILNVILFAYVGLVFAFIFALIVGGGIPSGTAG